MKQTIYKTKCGTFKAIITRFKGSKEYSVGYFKGVDALKAERVEIYNKLKYAICAAEAHVEVMQEQYC